jgi:G3E family GTPase
MKRKLLPVYVLSGFLGSGKTTLLNNLLKSPQFSRTAVIINEFGVTGLDHLFLSAAEDQIVELSNGCICCTLRGELASALAGLPVDAFDRVVVETTGLADPGPVIQGILTAAKAGHPFVPAGLIVLLDALNGPSQLASQPEAATQLALADLVAITKLDMVPDAEAADRRLAMEAQVRSHNATARILAIRDLSPARFLDTAADVSAGILPDLGGLVATHGHDSSRHGRDIKATVLRSERPLTLQAIEAFCELLTSAHASHLLRLTGIVAIEGSGRPLVVHAVHGVWHPSQWLDQWPDADATTKVVVVLRGMDAEFVERLFAGFANLPKVDLPDRQSLLENPLAIPGMRKT